MQSIDFDLPADDLVSANFVAYRAQSRHSSL